MSGMRKAKLPLLLGGLLLAGLAISGCRSEEQNRPLTFEKGTYEGQQDQKLTDEQLSELRQRANAQR
jgi:hypothetical protein